MKVLILAAGRGSRMKSETVSKPKCLIEFRGKPLLQHTLENLNSFFNAEDILIIGGYKSELLGMYWPSIEVNPHWASTNIMGSLMVASDILDREEVLVVYSDIFFEKSAVGLMLGETNPGILNLINWKVIWGSRFDNPLDDLENFFSQEKQIVAIGGKPVGINEINGQFGGMYTLNPSYWQEMKKNPSLKNLDTTTALNDLITKGKTFTAISYDGEWAEFDSIADIEKQLKKIN
jgi:choline kinase